MCKRCITPFLELKVDGTTAIIVSCENGTFESGNQKGISWMFMHPTFNEIRPD